MKTAHHIIPVPTEAPIQIVNITAATQALCAQVGLRHGLLTLISRHTTAFINLNEQEARLHEDMITFLKRLAPRDGDYAHNIAPVDDRDNAHAHLLGLFMNASESIPIVDGQLMLGGWQSIFLIELDGPRAERQVHLHFLGEA